MRFHVVSLPHTQTDGNFPACAYTTKVMGFCRMMMARGHEVILYSGAKNTAPCTEHVPCITEKQRAKGENVSGYVYSSFNNTMPHWKIFTANAIWAMKRRVKKYDFICLISGAQQEIAHAYGSNMAVEFGVGYAGTFSKYRVFESYAWMHTLAGAQSMNNAHGIEGWWYDAVIPGYLDPKDFPFSTKRKDSYLFVGRLDPSSRKGVEVASQITAALGAKLVVAGPGTPSGLVGDVEYHGIVGPKLRSKLMGEARALLAPTRYIEPFGNAVIEAMACGTPAITTDWGAFTETVVQGVTGYRCRNLVEFCNACNMVDTLDPVKIREHVVDNYSLDHIGQKYEAYFTRLLTLWGVGWAELGKFKWTDSK